MAKIIIKGLDEFKRALDRNPKLVLRETNKYFVRGIALLRKTVSGSPWRLGGSGGGVPVLSGNLKIAHETEIKTSYAKIFVNRSKARYAGFVHEGTRKMEARPWLDYAKMKNKEGIKRLQDELLINITKDLAK